MAVQGERRSEDSSARAVREKQSERIQRVIAETNERVDVSGWRRVRTCVSLSVVNKHTWVFTSQPCPLPSFLRTLLHWCRNPGKEAGTPLPLCPHHRDRHLRMSSSRSRDSTKNNTKRWWTWGQTRRGDSVPSSRTSGRTASCSGAGWTGRFGPVRIQQSRPRPPTCRYRRWGRRMTRRRSSTSLKRPRRHVGGHKRTGQCASSPC